MLPQAGKQLEEDGFCLGAWLGNKAFLQYDSRTEMKNFTAEYCRLKPAAAAQAFFLLFCRVYGFRAVYRPSGKTMSAF
ncbi:hypothetical protein CGZ60_00175 [Neisseria animalis]|nr:hypothetical protein CGZ60_00175 [Neisseria animalis]